MREAQRSLTTDSVRMTVSALRRLERWCDPIERLATRERPSRGISVRFEDVSRPAATDMGSVGPFGVSTPFGLPRDRPSRRIAPRDALRAPSDSLQRSIAAPPHRPGPPKESSSDDASSPGLSRPSTHAGSAVRLRGASGPTAGRGRFGYLLHGRDLRPSGNLAAPERPRASPFKAFSSHR